MATIVPSSAMPTIASSATSVLIAHVAAHTVRAGEVLTIPSNLPHKAEALEDTLGAKANVLMQRLGWAGTFHAIGNRLLRQDRG